MPKILYVSARSSEIPAALRELGYCVKVARSATTAFALVSRSFDPIKLLIADADLPDTSAPVLAANLRWIWPNLSAIYMSDNLDADLTKVGFDPAFIVLAKPFSFELLKRIVSVWMQ